MNSADEHLTSQPLPDEHLPDGDLPEGQSPDGHLLQERMPDNRVPVERFQGNQGTRWAAGTGVSGSLQSLLGTVVIAVFVITFIVQAFQIPSPSMENTLLVGDYLLVNKLCYGGGLGNYLMPYRKVQRGDIIVLHY